MTEKQKIYKFRSKLYGDEFMHFGIMGMRWGHRKAQDGGSSDSNTPSHKDVVRSLKSKIRDIKRARDNKQFSDMAADEDIAIKEHEERYKKKLDDINNSNSNIISKMWQKYDLSYKKDNDYWKSVGAVEDKHWDKILSSDKTLKAKVKSAVAKVDKEWDDEATDWVDKEFEGKSALGMLASFPKVLKKDAELSKKYEVKMLEAELAVLESGE